MPGSARFGGQIDASGILGEIYDSELRNREALAGQAAGRAREEQNALDRDAQSRWQSGEMSDGDWLAYVRERVAGSAGFPEERAEWEKVLRESADMIAVNQAEFAFQQGGSINQLIAFYQQRVKGQGGNSVAGRETQNRLNQLIDQRLSDTISREVEDLQDLVDAGKAKPQDLLNYLRDARGQARSNSDLARSLDKDIEQMDDQIAQFNRDYAISNLQHQWNTGQISGDEYASGIRAAAGAYANTDPSTYFGLLAEASVGDRYGSYGFDGAVGGGGRGTGGGRGGRGGPLTIGGLSAEWDDRRWRGTDILSQVMAGKTVVTDPGTGEQIDVTTAAGKRFLENVNRDVFSTFAAQRRVGTEIGDPDMVRAAGEGHDQFLLDFTQPSNTMLERESAGYLIQSVAAALAPGGRIDRILDPVAAQRELDRLADKVERFASSRGKEKITAHDNVNIQYDQPESSDRLARREAAAVDPGYVGELSMLAGALRTGQFDEGLNVTSGVGDLLNDADMENFTRTAFVIRDKAEGLGSRWTYAVLPNEGVSIVPMVTGTRQVVDPNTGAAQIVQVPMADPEVLADAGIKPGETHNEVAVAVQVGNSVIRMNGYSSMQATPWRVWQAAAAFTTGDGRKIERGMLINGEVYDAMSEDERRAYAQQGKMTQVPYMVETFAAPDERGKMTTYTRLPGGSWVRGAYPIRPDALGDGTVRLDADGSLNGTARPIESVPVPFMGRDPKLAQQAIDRGEFNDVIASVRAVNWETMDALNEPFNPEGSFWNEQDEAIRQRMAQSVDLARKGYTEDGGKRVDWWNQRSRERRGRDSWAATKRLNREQAKAGAVQRDQAANARGMGMLDDLFQNEGSSIGVSFGNRSRGRQGMPATPQRPASHPTPQMPEPPKVRLPRIGGPQNVDFIPGRLPAPQASSGPFITRTAERPTPSPQPTTSLPSFLSSFLGMGKTVARMGSIARNEKTPSYKRTRGGPTPL